MSDHCNILFIMADQFRADALACVGGYGKTDALDGLAREGVLFRNAVTNSPECMPARFALATGLYPHQTGIRRNGQQNMRGDAPSWIRVLSQAGYRTSLFGKSHFHQPNGANHDLRNALPLMHQLGLHDVDETAGPHSLQHATCKMTDGWDHAGVLTSFRDDNAWREKHNRLATNPSPLGVEHHYDTYVGESAQSYLKTYGRQEPWFCWVSFAGPHEPWDAPPPYDTMHAGGSLSAIPPHPVEAYPGGLLHAQRDRVSPRDDAEIRALRENYAGKVTLIDDQIAKILEIVRARGEDEQTLIVFTSDHGEMNGDHGMVFKSNFLAPAVDIPLIIRPPGRAKAGVVSDALVELIDIGDTILDYAGCAPLALSNGKSLKPILSGAVTEHRVFVLSEIKRSTMVSDGRWKAEFDAQGEVQLLFDTVSDPTELHNLAGSPECVPEAARLAAAWRGLLDASATEVKVD